MSTSDVPVMPGYVTLTDEGLLPVGTDVERAVTRGDERELIACRETADRRKFARRVLDDPATAERGPAAREVWEVELERTAPVSPLQELRATRRLVELIAGRRWITIQDAREAGATWEEIGAALELDPAQARAEFQASIERQEKWAAEWHDAERGRAALGDPVRHDPYPDLIDLDDGAIFEWEPAPAGGGEPGYCRASDHDFAWPRQDLEIHYRLVEMSSVDRATLDRLRERQLQPPEDE